MSITRGFNLKVIFIIVFAGLSLLLAACSAPAEVLNQDGNEAYSEQAYLEALQLYQSAQIESPELAEPYYNAANAFYRQEDYPAALEQLQMALQYVDEESLAESSLYNLGNSLFNSQELETAIEAYTQALLLDPHDQDAKYNLELALQQQQQQQEEQQEQEQESESQEQEQSESESEASGDQGEQGDEESQDGEDQGNESGDGENQDDQNDGDQEGDQGDTGGEPQEGQDQGEGDQPSQIPPPGQRMTEEQARQLLAAVANDMQTLQEKLGQYLFSRGAPPAQDW